MSEEEAQKIAAEVASTKGLNEKEKEALVELLEIGKAADYRVRKLKTKLQQEREEKQKWATAHHELIGAQQQLSTRLAEKEQELKAERENARARMDRDCIIC